eukprot:TRINITY_DN33680_c0_g1_i1.p1 TRINITY_DN33680_c0_g1~~TRINITY_DN33680_c0_g1_i1.p1  ORF type:complete len:526 (+),score=92.74 TRINITY_DN33680_c0_g1_i1:61-1578(+)
MKRTAALLLVRGLLTHTLDAADREALESDTECSMEGEMGCGLSALQHKAKVTASEKAGREDCHDARQGEPCFGEIQWAKTQGLRDHPEWYPGLTAASSDADFQLQVHAASPKKCPTPCKPAPAATSNATADCHDSRQGDPCFNEIQWAKTRGLHEHPEWYPGLTAASSDADFQALVHAASPEKCPMPCKPDPAASSDCHDARPGEACFQDVQWAKAHGVEEHPDWYPGLTAASSEREFQAHLHADNATKCPLPCEAPTEAALGAGLARELSVPHHTSKNTISTLQWNPHWECFVRSGDSCGRIAKQALDGMLNSGFLDFANICMFALEGGYQPPQPYAKLETRCGKDYVMMLYDSSDWQPDGDAKHVCSQGNDRAGIVQRFIRHDNSTAVTVAGVHFPHPGYGDLTGLKQAIKSLGGDKFILMADTNRVYESQKLLCELNPGHCGHAASTQLFNSCCHSDGFQNKGFDRVIANFGTHVQTEQHFSDARWKVGEFHQAVVGTFSLS